MRNMANRRHEVKSWIDFFQPVFNGQKRFELRRNDRDYAVGDLLVLKEYNVAAHEYTGRSCVKRIAYVFSPHTNPATMERLPPTWGLEPGYCILGLEDSP